MKYFQFDFDIFNDDEKDSERIRSKKRTRHRILCGMSREKCMKNERGE